MAENLNYNIEGSKCYEDNELNCQQYGRLYNWNDAMQICPRGWHLPTRIEWEILAKATGDKETAGKKLKSKTGWSGFQDKHGGGTDDFGFSALPGISGNHGSHGAWWSATEEKAGFAYVQVMCNEFDYIYEQGENMSNVRFSVRCVKDDAMVITKPKTPEEEEEARYKELEAAWAEESKNCPDGKIGSPKTVEAVFGGIRCGDYCNSIFTLSNGEELGFQAGELGESVTELWVGGKVVKIKEGTKVSVTYQKEQEWIHRDGDEWCNQSDVLQSVKVLSNGEEGAKATEENCPDKAGPLQTAEATFLEADLGPNDYYIHTFRLADGNEINLYYYGDQVKDLKKGDKASVTYKEIQMYDPPDGCFGFTELESVKILPK
jgi:uncharacterized protein (TIGR02145 family)